MGLLAFNRLISVRRDRRRRRRRRRRPIQGPNGSVTSGAKRKDSPCPRDANSRSEKKSRYSAPTLPEDIWHHIYSLLPLRDAARVACVSHSFRRSWRRYPSLAITSKTLGLDNEMLSQSCRCSAKVFAVVANRTKHILKNHSGVGIKELELQIIDFPILITSSDVDRWLRMAIRPGIEKLCLCLCLHSPSRYEDVYNFPSQLLLGGSGKSVQHLHLSDCVFRPTAEPGRGCLTSLTSLTLRYVRITGDELRCLLSGSVALVKLRLVSCNKMVFLEIPSLLQRLGHLEVQDCKKLQVIESRSPNLRSLRYTGAPVRLSLGDSLQNLKFFQSSWDVFDYACKYLPHMVPNLEIADISSKKICTLVVPVPGTFLQLRRMGIGFISPDFDYLSLVPLLDACPSLETFKLYVYQDAIMAEESVLGDSCHDLRHMQGHLHRNIKDVEITGFCASKSLVELTCHILENAKSLGCLTLRTLYESGLSCSYGNGVKCLRMSREMIMEAHQALSVVQRYIVGKVPSSVELKVVEPCSGCNPL